MSSVLGFSAWFHDSAACLMIDDEVVAFAEEERFNRKKHTGDYPRHAIDFCLDRAGLKLDQVDAVVYYFKPWRYLLSSVGYVLKRLPRSLNLLRADTTVYPLKTRVSNILRIKSILCKEHGARGDFQVVYLPHYYTHQAGAFLCSPFEEAAIITMDVAVDGVTQTISTGRQSNMQTLLEHYLPHSWAMIYLTFTNFLGFRLFDEYKVMGMAAYGKPLYADFMEDRLYKFDEGTGDFQVNLEYFDYPWHSMRRTWGDRLVRELGQPRQHGAEYTQRDFDIAASVQLATERFGLKMARFARGITGQRRLCMGGGVVQNVLMNQRILEAGIFDEVFLQPLAGDMGCPLGAVLYYRYCLQKAPRAFNLRHLYWGPDYSDQYEEALKRNNLKYHYFDNSAKVVAKALAEGMVVGFFSQRMEAGPRALGARSILADPRRADMKDILNRRVKHREFFRPFAPSCLEEYFNEIFEPLPGCQSLGYMVVTVNVRQDKQKLVPAISHADGTARPQAVSKYTHPLYWEIMEQFRRETGIPLVINTSFNDNEPIVCTPQDAIDCFIKTHIDMLVFANYVVYRSENNLHSGTAV